MNKPLTKRQEEILTVLQEECAEVIQVVSKIRRFGWGDAEYDNVERLKAEIADLLLLIVLTVNNKIVDISTDELEIRMEAKRKKLSKFSSIFKDENE